jgi:hypothetical protein
MRVRVDCQDEGVEFDLPPERLVASWRGPDGVDPSREIETVRVALEQPHDYPALRQIVVPGDRVVVALDPTVPRPGSVLVALGQILGEAGIEPESLTVLTRSHGPAMVNAGAGAPAVHDPGERTQLAYLASTKPGRRVYLNRLLTDADVVIPVGRLGFDALLGYCGPWSALFPDLSDRDTIRAVRGELAPSVGSSPNGVGRRARLDESIEVSWLLGTQFHLGLLPAATGLLAAVAGRDTSVRDRGIDLLERTWRFQAPARAEVVVAGVGRPGTTTTLQDLADALSTATQLVVHGGKIVVLSHASGAIGPALRKLMDHDDPRAAIANLQGTEDSDDYAIARQLATSLAWADVFLYSDLEQQLVEDLAIVPLERLEAARRLVARSGSAVLLSHAELTLAAVQGEENVKSPGRPPRSRRSASDRRD